MPLCLVVARVLAVLLAFCIVAPQLLVARVTPSHGFDMFSAQEEVQAGQQASTQVSRQLPILPETDPITIYVQRLGRQLAAHAPGEKWPYSFHVVNQKEINAFALPGGPVYVNLGTIQAADNEAELAGVMAHEIAHVAARHGTRQATRGEIDNLATIPLIFMGGWTGYGIRQAASVLVPVGFLKFSRGFESEADMLGLEYMYKAGYDPTSFVDFFEKIETLEKRKPGTMAKVFSTHPMTDDRIRNAQKNIQEILVAKPEYVVNTSEFNDVKNRLLAMHNRRKVDDKDPNKPQLRRAPGSTTGPIDADEDGKKPKSDEDERPTLKRRPSN